ncbi:hypothetical protein ACLB2K_026167 [Fragaria x ananassa]
MADALVAEALALREGLLQLKQHSSQALIIEGDSKILIDVLLDNSECPWRIKVLVHDIQQLMHHFEAVSFKHVGRKANFMAVCLASLGHIVTGTRTWLYQLPSQVQSAFYFDLLGIGCVRERDRVWIWCAVAIDWALERATRGGGSIGSGSGASEAGGVTRQATVCGGCSGRGDDGDGIDGDGLGSRVVESEIGDGGLVAQQQ